ncbi:uncharacterized protein LOC108741037 [Agrilus planipennis]|uniref:Uncharacterized protein LOC108741037 n=1 Tax=Agrilus planipennis TaxID=224129 RepID=A0A1W4X4T3_AGRPL|nr:uncharacterized protein LOC108741037 [Agrilus planipennis]
MKGIILIFSFLTTLLNNSLALECYSCGWDAGNVDENCVKEPSLVNNGVLVCDKRYCYSIRVEQAGKVTSMYRSCADKPQYINKLIKYDDFKIYHMACTTTLCNSGSGKEIYGSGSGSSGILYVPGYGYGGSTALKSKYTHLILLVVVVVYRFM